MSPRGVCFFGGLAEKGKSGMIRFIGAEQTPFCDGHTRRSFLEVGFLGLGGLALPQLLEARAQKGVAAKKNERHLH